MQFLHLKVIINLHTSTYLILTPHMEKSCHYIFAHNFDKCWLIIKILSCWPIIKIDYTSHHSSNLSQHYFVKHSCKKTSDTLKHNGNKKALGQCIPLPRHILLVYPDPYPDPWSRSPPKFNYLFIDPWKFHANPFGSFCEKLLTDKQTTKT